MKRQNKAVAGKMLSPRDAPATVSSIASRLRRRPPAIVKVLLTAPLVMALVGAEIELRLAPQLDVILTAAGIWAIWAWLAGRSARET